MFLDFYDHRPDTPRLPRSLTRLEQVLLVVVGYLMTVVIYLVVPDSFWQSTPLQPLLPRPEQMSRLVHIEPLVDRPARPRRPAPDSDLDRRSTTVERAPKPENDEARSRGNVPDKVESVRAEQAKGADSSTPPSPDSSVTMNSPNLTSKVAAENPAESAPPPGVLGRALRNLRSYLQDQKFDNPQGGQTETGADIQFDSKGVDFGSWLRRFRAQVYGNWIPFIPTAADYQRGDVVIQLDIHKDGTITNLHIVRSSGHQSLDAAAFNALKLSNPTTPLPAAFPDEVAPFTVTFRYILREPARESASQLPGFPASQLF